MDLNQKIFKYFVYYPVVLVKYGNFPGYLNEFLQSQYFPIDKLHEIQLKKLKSLVKYIREHVPSYNKRLEDISEENISRLEDIELLPFTTKALIKNYPQKLTSGGSFRFLTKKTTSGSTGEPVTILKTANAMGMELAATWRAYSWAKIDIGDRQGRFWSVPSGDKDRQRARLTDLICNRKRCSAFSFDEASLEKYTNMLSKFNPIYFYGYVSMLTEYANFFEKKRVNPPFDLKCIIPTAEALTSSQRELLEEVFDTRVFNEYGSGELGSVAHECEAGSMHIMAENMIVEVLDGEEKACNPGEVGELVITELNNRAMPLIRYRTGDFASLSDKQCACGKTLPVIEEIIGRAYDVTRNTKGRMFCGGFFTGIFNEVKKRNLGVGAFQVIQLAPNKLKIKIKPETGYSKATEDFIESRIRSDFHPDIILEIEKVESIPRESSGKMRIVVGMNNLSKITV